jgi:predicted CoA-binding protein
MQDEGYEIIPVNPTIDEALGVKAVASLKDVEGPIPLSVIMRYASSFARPCCAQKTGASVCKNSSATPGDAG